MTVKFKSKGGTLMHFESHRDWCERLFAIGMLNPEHERCLYNERCQVNRENDDG